MWPLRVAWPTLEAAALTSKALTLARKARGVRGVWLLSSLAYPFLGLRAAGATLRVLLPDVARSVRVWRSVLPIFLMYMWTKHSCDLASWLFGMPREAVEERWARRHQRGADQVHHMVTQVKGYYIKSAQVLATKREFIPAPWCDRLSEMWDSTPPRPWRSVRRSILRDLGDTELAARLRELRQERQHPPQQEGPISETDLHATTSASSTNATPQGPPRTQGRSQAAAPSGALDLHEQQLLGAETTDATPSPALPHGHVPARARWLPWTASANTDAAPPASAAGSSGAPPATQRTHRLVASSLKQLSAASAALPPGQAQAAPSRAAPSTASGAAVGSVVGGGPSVSGLSVTSWAASSASWLLGGGDGGRAWGRWGLSAGVDALEGAAGSAAAVKLLSNGGLPPHHDQQQHGQGGTGAGAGALPPEALVGSLFTVSPTAVAVLRKRAEEHAAVAASKQRRCRRWWGWWGRARGEDGAQATGWRSSEGAARHDRRLSQWFASINPEPLASASIAQVHTAMLSPELLQLLGSSWTHGPEVVIKVQHADVQRLMGADLRNMGRIARFLGRFLPFDVTPAVQEMQNVIPKEFDFEREARLCATLRARLAPVYHRTITVPEPLMPLCGPGIIVMQRMHGTPLTALLEGAREGDRAARDKCRRCLEPVLDALGWMFLVEGVAHCDPHPGNLILQPDGKVALLDFGQAKVLAVEERRTLCALYLALAQGDTRAALAAVAPFGLTFGGAASSGPPPPEASPPTSGARPCVADGPVNLQAASKMLHIMFNTKWMAEASYGFGGGDVVEGAPLMAFPGPLYLLCRAILIIRGICAALGLRDVDAVAMWRRWAQAGLREKEHLARARAAENMALDRGLHVRL